MRVRIKICGITRLEDAVAAVQAGADALGFNFYPGSPRYIAPERAGRIVAELPPFVTTVGLFVDASRDEVELGVDAAQVALLQFNGDESPAFCESIGRPYIKVVRVAGAVDGNALATAHRGASAFLLDTFVAGMRGGTGRRFDWACWPSSSDRPLILAGGLDETNVAAAIAATRPFAVDVSSGVEAGEPGVKSASRMERFVSEVVRASQGL
jgi:phosphoribosylanthranilate isomerase